MQPIVKWQYEKLEGTLGLLEDHLADPDCPCHSAGRKLCPETSEKGRGLLR